jgi:hypothetical protein
VRRRGPSVLVWWEAFLFFDFGFLAQHYLVTTSGKSWSSRADSLYNSVTHSRDGSVARDMDPLTRVSTHFHRPSVIQVQLCRSERSNRTDMNARTKVTSTGSSQHKIQWDVQDSGVKEIEMVSRVSSSCNQRHADRSSQSGPVHLSSDTTCLQEMERLESLMSGEQSAPAREIVSSVRSPDLAGRVRHARHERRVE